MKRLWWLGCIPTIFGPVTRGHGQACISIGDQQRHDVRKCRAHKVHTLRQHSHVHQSSEVNTLESSYVTCGPRVTYCGSCGSTMVKAVASKCRGVAGVSTEFLLGCVGKGMSERSIAASLCAAGVCVSKTTIHRRLVSLRAAPGVSCKTRAQHQKILDPRIIRWLDRTIRIRNVRTTSSLHTELQQQGYRVSKRTLLRALQSVRTLRLGRPRRRIYLTRKHVQHRYEWARQYLNNNLDWTQV